MKLKRTRIWAVVLALALVLTTLTVTALADGAVTTETELHNAIEEATENTISITLGADIELTAPISIPADKTITINGGGHTISYAFNGSSGVKCAFTGSVANQIEGVPAGVELTVNNVKFENTSETESQGYAVLVGCNSDETKVTLTGCSFKNLYCAILANPVTDSAVEAPVLTVSSSIFIDTKYAFSVDEQTEGAVVGEVEINESGNTTDYNFQLKEEWTNVVATVTSDGTTKAYQSLANAITAANAVTAGSPVTVEIVKSGSYDPFTITRANVTVQAAENVDAEIEVSSTKTGNINAANVTLKGLNYVSTDGTTIFSAGDCDNLKLDGCSFTSNKNGTALYIHMPNITITGCTFTNFERGYYTCGDNHAAGEMTFTNNTFNNVRVPIDGYWGKTATDDTDIQITGNTINVGSWGTSYIQLWDYAQYLTWAGNTDADHQGSAIDATIKNNTYNGDVVIYATHFDWFSESDLELDDASEALLKYRVLVELEGAASATVRNADGSEITAFNESTTSSTRGSKTVIYSICVGDYLFDIKPTDSEAVLHKNATIKKSETGDTNKVTVSADESAVAKVGDKTYTSFAAAIEAAKDGGTMELLSDVTVDVWNQAWNAKNLTIKGNGFTWTVGKVESNVNGNYLFYGAENLQVNDLTVIFQTNGNGFDMVSGSLDNVKMYGGANSNYAVFVGSSDKDAKVSIEKCVFENFKGAAVYSQPAGTDKRTSDITVNKTTISNCGMTMCSYAQNTVFTNNSVTGGSEISFAGAVENSDRENAYRITGNTFQNAGKIWFSDADLSDVTFTKNKVLGSTTVSTEQAQIDTKLDVSENYWGGGAPSTSQLQGNDVTGTDVYYVRDTMRPGDLNTDYTVTIVYKNGASNDTYYVPADDNEFTLPAKPARKGYTFLGWKSSADRKVYKAGADVKIYKDTTFTAQWMSNWEIVDDIAGAAGSGNEFFTDVKGSAWYYDAVKFVYENGFMDGVGDNKFNPNGTLTRAMIAQVLYNLEGETSSYPTVFDDVAKSAWYADAVNWAAASGIVEGKGNNKFDPNAAITRQEMAAILYRYSELKGYDVSDVDSLSSFTDASKVASWAKEAMGWAVENYVINGKGNGKLDPTGTATRAEVAQILMNLCNNVL